MKIRVLLTAFVAFGSALGTARAQESAAAELFQRVPDELGVCLVIHDLRGHVERWSKTSWLPKLLENPLVRSVLDGKELNDLKEVEKVLKQHLDFDFAHVRDEILGDGVVFAYQPAKGDGAVEKGLLLVKVRKAETLANAVDKFNEFQTNIGELTSNEIRKHKDQTYYRRVHQQATHYYVLKGTLLAISNREELIHALLDRDAKAVSVRRDQWLAAGLSKAAATLWINPRILDAEFTNQAKNKTGPEAIVSQSIATFWQGIDGVFVSLQGDEIPEARLTFIARPGSAAAKVWSEPAGPPLELWRRFPENALISAALPIDFTKALKKFKDVIPEKDAAGLDFLLQKNLGAATGLDAYREVLPNLGPDVGISVTLPDGETMPRAIIALAAKAAPKDAPVDQMLYKAANLFIGLAVFDYNRKNTDAIRVRTIQQDGVEVKHLSQDKLFPAGVQPAFALKEGYLLVASASEAIADFRADRSAASAGEETPLVKIAPRQWSRLLKAHRQAMIDHLIKKNNDTPAAAGNVVDGLAAGFDLFQSLTLTQQTGNARSAWILRLAPAK